MLTLHFGLAAPLDSGIAGGCLTLEFFAVVLPGNLLARSWFSKDVLTGMNVLRLIGSWFRESGSLGIGSCNASKLKAAKLKKNDSRKTSWDIANQQQDSANI